MKRTAKPTVIRSFTCYPKGRPEWMRDVPAASAGRARYSYWLDVSESWPDVRLTEIVARVAGGGYSEPRGFRECVEGRAVGFAKIGMRIVAEGYEGFIVGFTGSANLKFWCPATGTELCAHPSYDVQYFADDGKLIVHIKRGVRSDAREGVAVG